MLNLFTSSKSKLKMKSLYYMKKYALIFLLLLFSVSILSQSYNSRRTDHRREKNNKNIVTDTRGDLIYEDRQGNKASLSKNIFGDKIYKDNRNNEITYSENIWSDVFPEYHSERDILSWLVESLLETRDLKEKYRRNIHGDIEYENNKGLRASLSKSIFDEGIYKDNNNNEIKYSKEYWSDILSDFRNKDVQAFFWIMDQCQNLKNYREEYKIDIFGHQQYKNNRNQTASVSKDIFDKMIYKDSKGTTIEYSLKEWDRIVRKNQSDKKAFMKLIQNHLLNK